MEEKNISLSNNSISRLLKEPHVIYVPRNSESFDLFEAFSSLLYPLSTSLFFLHLSAWWDRKLSLVHSHFMESSVPRTRLL